VLSRAVLQVPLDPEESESSSNESSSGDDRPLMKKTKAKPAAHQGNKAKVSHSLGCLSAELCCVAGAQPPCGLTCRGCIDRE